MIYQIILPNGKEVQLESDEITFDISKVIAFYDVNQNLLGVFPKESGFYLIDKFKELSSREIEKREFEKFEQRMNLYKTEVEKQRGKLKEEFDNMKKYSEVLTGRIKDLETENYNLKYASLFKRIFQWKF